MSILLYLKYMENIPQEKITREHPLLKERSKEVFDQYMKDFPLTEEDLHKPLLEVGASRGDFIQFVREEYGNTEAYGVDKSQQKPHMLAEGMVIADGLALPFEDEKFEIVIARNYLSMFLYDKSENETVLNELLRVTKSGGKVMANISSIETIQGYINDEDEVKAKEIQIKRLEGMQDFNLRLEKLEKDGYKIHLSGIGDGGRKKIIIEKP